MYQALLADRVTLESYATHLAMRLYYVNFYIFLISNLLQCRVRGNYLDASIVERICPSQRENSKKHMHVVEKHVFSS